MNNDLIFGDEPAPHGAFVRGTVVYGPEAGLEKWKLSIAQLLTN
jgi:hypothetical protein